MTLNIPRISPYACSTFSTYSNSKICVGIHTSVNFCMLTTGVFFNSKMQALIVEPSCF